MRMGGRMFADILKGIGVSLAAAIAFAGACSGGRRAGAAIA